MFERGRRRRLALALLLGVAQIVWATWMTAAAVVKIAEYGGHEFVRHYTNWSWALQALFYFATAPVPFVLVGVIDADSTVGNFVLNVLVIGFLPLHGVVWFVLTLVSLLLATKAELFNDVLAEIAPTWVMLGDSVYHFWPVVGLLLYYIAYRRVIYVALNRVYARQRLYESAPRLSVFLLYEAFAGSLFSLAVYSLLFDPQSVYKTDLAFGLGLATVLGTLALVNALPLLIVLGIHRVGRRTEYPPGWLRLDDADPEVWARMDTQTSKRP